MRSPEKYTPIGSRNISFLSLTFIDSAVSVWLTRSDKVYVSSGLLPACCLSEKNANDGLHPVIAALEYDKVVKFDHRWAFLGCCYREAKWHLPSVVEKKRKVMFIEYSGFFHPTWHWIHSGWSRWHHKIELVWCLRESCQTWLLDLLEVWFQLIVKILRLTHDNETV